MDRADARSNLTKLGSEGAGLAPITLVMIVIDLVLRSDFMDRWDGSYWVVYACSSVIGALSWWLAFLVVWTIWTRWRRVGISVVIIGSVSVCFLLIASFVYQTEFVTYPTPSTLLFLMQESQNVQETTGLIGVYFTMGVTLSLILLPVALSALWLWLLSFASQVRANGPDRRRILVVALAWLVLLSVRVAIPARAVAAPPDANLPVILALTLKHYVTRTEGRFYKSKRHPVPKLEPTSPPPNVLLIVQESLGRARMGLYHEELLTTPVLRPGQRRSPTI